MMQKYYYIEYPASKPFIKNKRCIQYDGMNCFVPCELVDNQSKTQS